MAEKGAPRAANNPNTTQLRGAPMNLRSAMQKYADGGGVGSPPPTAGDINSFVQANIGNPQAIADAARQYGVSMDDLAGATGYSSSQISDYFGNAGINPFEARPSLPPVEGSGTFNVPPQPADIPLTYMPNEGLNEPDMPRTTGQPPYDYGSVPELNRSAIDAARLATQNPPQVDYSSIPPELLKKIKEMSNPFSSQLTQQDDLAKLIQLLKAR